MYLKPAAPQTVGGVVDDAIKLYRAAFRSCWVISLIGTAAALAVSIWMLSSLAGLSALGSLTPGVRPDFSSLLLQLSGAMYQMSKGYLIVNIVSLLVLGALFAQTSVIQSGQPALSVGDAFVMALRRLVGMIGGSIIFVVAIGVGMFFLFIPGIYLWGKLEFWFAAMFAEQTGAIDSLGRSWNVTGGNWWRSVTIISVALIIMLVLQILIYVVSGAIIGVPLLLHQPDFTSWALIVPVLVRGLMSVFIFPIYPAVMLATYHDMKLRREGGDLAARAQSLQSA